MQKKSILRGSFAAAATVSMLVACGPAPTATPSPSPSASASVAPSAAPSASAEPSAAPSASAEPTAAPSASAEPTAAPSVAPSVAPSAAATATPLPSATSDISVIEKTTFNGKAYDDTFSPLDGVTVKVRSLNSSVPYEAETVTAGGTYAFNNAPSGVQVEIIASKPGFTTRKRVEVLKSNKQGDPNANRYDFGSDSATNSTFSASYNALSDKPEVTMVTPARNGSGVDPKTSFVIKFSEPMDKKTAEDTFAVRAFNSRKLTVDGGNTRGVTTTAIAGITGSTTIVNVNKIDSDTVAGSGEIKNPTGSQIWDKDAFNISWNSDDTEATFSFKEEKLLPTDKDSNLVPDYEVAFRAFSSNDRVLKDKSGISRTSNHFKLTDGDFEESYKFAIKTDEVKPTISSITAETNENGGQNGDAIRVRYSERMIIYTRDVSIAGGMDKVTGSEQKAPAGYPGDLTNATTTKAAANYNLTVIQSGGGAGATTYSGTWQALGGTAVYDTTDLTHKTVLLLPATQGSLTSTIAAAGFVAPANNDAVTMSAVLSDGTTVTPSTFSYKTQSTNALTTGATSVNGAAGATASFVYSDGSIESGVTVPTATVATYTGANSIQAQLQTLLTAGTITVTETTNAGGGTAGSYDQNDVVNITLNNGATRTPASGGGAKSIAWITLGSTGAFAAATLNLSGYVIVPATSDPLVAQACINRGFDTTGGRFTVTEGVTANGTFAANDTVTLALGADPLIGGKKVKMITISQAGLFASTKLNTPTSSGFVVFPNTVVNAKFDIYKPGDTVRIKVNSTVLDPAGNTLDSSRDNASANAS